METRLRGLGDLVQALDAKVSVWTGHVEAIDDKVDSLEARMVSFSGGLETEKSRLIQNLGEVFDQHKLALQQTRDVAGLELGKIQSEVHELYQKTDATFREVVAKISEMDQAGTQPGGTGLKGTSPGGGLLPMKSIIPGKFGKGKEEDWTKWKEDILDYVDQCHACLKHVLISIDKCAGAPNDDWKMEATKHYGPTLTGGHMSAKVFRLIKHLTEGEARHVVMGTEKDQRWILHFASAAERFIH